MKDYTSLPLKMSTWGALIYKKTCYISLYQLLGRERKLTHFVRHVAVNLLLQHLLINIYWSLIDFLLLSYRTQKHFLCRYSWRLVFEWLKSNVKNVTMHFITNFKKKKKKLLMMNDEIVERVTNELFHFNLRTFLWSAINIL